MTVTCYELDAWDDEGHARWRELQDPPLLVVRAGDLVIELPATRKPCRAFVNGVEVIGVQAVQWGDVIRICSSGTQRSYVVGERVPVREAGRNRTCSFTGLPIAGRAVCCPCGGIVAEEIVPEIQRCPRCSRRLHDVGTKPAEEMA